MAEPDKIRIAYENSEYARFDCVGRLSDGTQFMAFVTGAFPSGEQYYLGDDWPAKKRWLSCTGSTLTEITLVVRSDSVASRVRDVTWPARRHLTASKTCSLA